MATSKDPRMSGHRVFGHDCIINLNWQIGPNIRRIAPSISAPVAQLDRVLGYEPSGREFESLQARHPIKKPTARWVFLWDGLGGDQIKNSGQSPSSTNSPGANSDAL